MPHSSDYYEDIILGLLDLFEPTSPTTFIGSDGTTVVVPDEVEQILDDARKALDDECPFDSE